MLNYLKTHKITIKEDYIAINTELLALIRDNREELKTLAKQMKKKNIRVGAYTYKQLEILANINTNIIIK